MNHIDIADCMIEVVQLALKKSRYDTPLTWNDILLALEDYRVEEQKQIDKLRAYKKFGNENNT